MVMSPTFELKHPEILVKVAGQGARARIIIDGYEMYEFNGLLFNGMKQKIDTGDEFQWIRFGGDLHRYQGHRMHLEFLDEGHGWFVVQEVRFAERGGAPPPTDSPNPVNIRLAENVGADNDVTAAGSQPAMRARSTPASV